MKYIDIKLFFASAILLTSLHATGQSLYLTCEIVGRPKIDLRTIYSKRPLPTVDEFVGDMIMSGNSPYLSDIATSWKIDLGSKKISSPEVGVGVTEFHIQEATDVRVLAYGKAVSGDYEFILNRITGQFIYSVQVSEEAKMYWKRTHKGVFPPSLAWTQKCKSSTFPTIR